MAKHITKSGIEYIDHEDGFIPLKPEHQNPAGVAQCVAHFHKEKHDRSNIHWTVRIGVFGVGVAMFPEAGLALLLAFFWNEFNRTVERERGFSSGVCATLKQHYSVIQASSFSLAKDGDAHEV